VSGGVLAWLSVWSADLHMAQLMPLPLTTSCFSKIHIGFTFLVPAHPGSPRQKAVKSVCVCVIPWHGGHSLVWDATVPLAASYVDRAATDAGTVADMAATRKTEKYSTLSSAYSSRKTWRLQFHNS